MASPRMVPRYIERPAGGQKITLGPSVLAMPTSKTSVAECCSMLQNVAECCMGGQARSSIVPWVTFLCSLTQAAMGRRADEAFGLHMDEDAACCQAATRAKLWGWCGGWG